MKGGLVLLFLMYSGYLFLILSRFSLKISTTDFACWFYILAHMTFQFVELLWFQTTSPHVLMVSLCMGRLAASRNHVIEED
jgi:hypothetical protein